MQKRGSNNYFNFTRKERTGTVFLLFIILLLTTMPLIYSLLFKEKIINAGNIENELAVLRIKQKDSTRKYYPKNFDEDNYQHYDSPSGKKTSPYSFTGTLFNFDPNTISAAQWKKLGVRDKTINTIQHFIAKGGKFRQPDDIKKIWGLHEDEIDRLLPYIKIEETVSSSGPVKQESLFKNVPKKQSVEMIDINMADTTALILLPGIGSKLSNRIINFRDKLGGFYSVEQVAETFGLPDSVFQKIRPLLILGENELKKVNINTATLDELKQHPYIRYKLANQLVQYRNQHGNFSAISDMKKIMTVTEELYNKLSPYLTSQ